MKRYFTADTIIFAVTFTIWVSSAHFVRFKKSQTPLAICKPGDRKLIIMDASGWYSPFYMGFMEFIFETYGRDAFKNVVFSGLSGGGHAAGYSIATVHGPSHKNMRYWLTNGQQFAVSINKYHFGNLTDGCYLSGVSYYNICHDDNITNHIRDNYFSIGTNFFGQLVTCDTSTSADEFGRAVASTGNIPIIGSLFPIIYRGIYLWDGLFTWIYSMNTKRTDIAPLYSNKSTLIFTMMSENKFILEPNVHVINIRKITVTPIPKSVIQTMAPSFQSKLNAHDFCDKWFYIGYMSAKINHSQYANKIKAFIDA
jgi:hypothetical protein